MKTIKKTILLGLLFCYGGFLHAQSAKTFSVENFDKVIVSPYIEVVFKQGDTESVVLEEMNESLDIFNVDQKKRTLHLYLDNAKITSPTETMMINGEKQKRPIYKGTIAKVTITYKSVDVFELRGEEQISFLSPIKQKKAVLRIYGESEVSLPEVHLQDFRLTIYGESEVYIKEAKLKNFKVTMYGEGLVEIKKGDIEKQRSRAFGEGTFRVLSKEEI